MSQISISEILELPVKERIHIVELIWGSIAVTSDILAISAELKSELEQHLAV
jgi:putative addiction module component (TIGR02574 family)